MSRAIANRQQCKICHCTEANPCFLDIEFDEPFGHTLAVENDLETVTTCHWVAPNLCSNPTCVAAESAQFSNAVLIG